DRWFQGLTLELQSLVQAVSPVPGAAPVGEGPEPTPYPLPPLWYCKRRTLLFVPPCPVCGEPLAECRDDAALVAGGLVSRATSPHRHVSCPRCAGEANAPHFYSLSGEPAGHPSVGDRWALVEGFGQRVAASRDTGNLHFPCQGCTFSQSCYPLSDGAEPGEASTLLVPLSFCGGEAWPVELLPLGYGAASDLLGGRPRAELPLPWAPPVADETPRAANTGAFLFAAEREQRLPLEALLLKLTVFEQVCAGVEVIHRSLGRPHLNLNPGTARVALGGGGGAAPAWWRSQAQAVGLEGARPVAAAGEDAERGFLPPFRFDLAYSHPGVAVCPGQGVWQPARFAVLAVVDDPAGGCVVDGVLETERLRPGEAGPADTFQLGLGQGLGFRSELQLPCACRGSSGGGVALRSAPVQLAAADRERLASLKALPQVEVRFTMLRRYGAECDLFSLGMLLFRSLLANRSQTMDEVSQRCRFVAAELERGAGATGMGGDGKPIAENLERGLLDPLFDAGNLLWEPLAPGNTPVPSELWGEVLELGFRLLTGIPGFSFLAAGAAAEAVDGMVIGRLRDDLCPLLEKARQSLFAWQPAPATDIRAVLTGLIDDPEWLDRVLALGSGDDARPAPTPMVTAPDGPAVTGPEVQSVAPAPVAPESGLDETVILRPGQVAAALSSAREQASAGVTAGTQGDDPAEPAFDETMILQRPPGRTQSAPTPAAPVAGSGFEETMILRPGAPGVPRAPQAEDATSPAQEGQEGEDFEKTMILRRGKPPGSR
ncbi:MAG: hypothetical protein P1P84_08485, partial [Deferrisomatales bacterium]|nr:hypothetical protein [Deferrisomatales bacterium]